MHQALVLLAVSAPQVSVFHKATVLIYQALVDTVLNQASAVAADFKLSKHLLYS
jgi:hypothetical protein